MIRILYITKVHPYPPSVSGDSVYSRGIIESLSAKCNLTVLCGDSGAPLMTTGRVDWRIAGPQRRGRAGSILSPWPLIAWKGNTPRYKKMLKRLLEYKWDVIVLDNIGSAHALNNAIRYRAKNPHVQLLYVSHEYEYITRREKYLNYKMNILERALSMIDLQKVKMSEEKIIRECDIVTIINKDELEHFRKICPKKKYLVLIPGYDGPIVAFREINDSIPRRVLILGGRQSEQKRQILIDWMEASYVRLKQAGIETIVAGSMDDSLCNRIKTDYPDVIVLGFVDNLTALAGSARMGIVADTVGGGFKLRLLSHVFERLPIVGLNDAVSGLPTKRGEGWLGSDNLTDLVEQVCAVIDDTACLNSLQDRAFADCASAFSWGKGADDLVTALGEGRSKILV